MATKNKKMALNEITNAYNAMHEALRYYKAGIDHFYNCINFKKSPLDADAIAFMNDSNIKISKALKLADKVIASRQTLK